MEKKKINWLKIALIVFFIGYLSLYILDKTGYYDSSMRKKTEFTNNQIKRFEQDVKDGKQVDINDYLIDENKDYTNNTSKVGYYISSSIEKILSDSIKNIGNIFKKLFT